MSPTYASHPRRAWSGELRRSRGILSQFRAPVLVGLIAAAALLLAPALASADNPSSLTVVGTSDANDSGLMPSLIQPQFQKAFPQFTFKYVPSATGTAIQSAESGAGGPSVLIVHAPSLESQFVGGGFSYKNQYGNAIFTNDFVLAGPTSDPATVDANAANNAGQAFADVAVAGAADKATFLTRGGASTASGTTVGEHSIWALVHSAGLQPATLSLCVVSAADGGGMSPVKSPALNSQPCPDSGTVNSADAPSWYFVNAGANQGANVIAANACTAKPSGPNSCYVLSDRGTYDYLASGTDPAGSVPNLKIVTRNNSAAAPGGANELINYFHVYIINPSKPGETVNVTAAQDFVTFLTSPAFQAQLKSYLAKTSDPGGPPFVADASPILTAGGIPKTYHAGKPVTVSGTLINAEPGYPTLSNEPVSIDEVVGGLPLTVATGKTNSTGQYSIPFSPTSTGSYEVSTNPISKIENTGLTPPYGDLLSPAATVPVNVTVDAGTSNFHVKSDGGKVLVTGSVAPGSGHVKATVTVLARAVGARGPFRNVATSHLAATQGNFAMLVPRAARTWQFKVKFQDPQQVVAASSRILRVRVGLKPASGIGLHSVRANRGTLTVGGGLTPAAARGAKVELLGLNPSPGAPARFTVLGSVKLDAGKTKFTLHAHAKRGVRWVLQLEYLRPGQAPSFGGLRTVAVK